MTFTYLCFILVLRVFTVEAAEGAGWCYEIQKLSGDGLPGPREWEGTCASGTQQSPINIVTRKTQFDSKLKPFHFTGYGTTNTFLLINNGHSAELLLNGGNFEISGGGLSGTYVADQLHFHWGSSYTFGSEHSIDGERYPIEMHIVHKKASGRSASTGGATPTETGSIAVLGFFIEEAGDSENTKYRSIVQALSSIQTLNSNISVAVTLKDLIPEEKFLEHFYRYNGSLTTPPCTQGLTWTVFPETIKLSQQQIKAFYSSLNYAPNATMAENFRPQQKLGSRTVYTSGVEAVLSHSAYLLLSFILAYVVSES